MASSAPVMPRLVREGEHVTLLLNFVRTAFAPIEKTTKSSLPPALSRSVKGLLPMMADHKHSVRPIVIRSGQCLMRPLERDNRGHKIA